jgi:hypothetical protein
VSSLPRYDLPVKAAADVVPSPHAIVGVVSPLFTERALVVRIADSEAGYARSAWRTAYQALKQAEQNGWRTSGRTVRGSTDTTDSVAYAVAGDDVFGGLLKFRFNDDSAYLQLVGNPGLTAFVLLDRSSHRLLRCKFCNAKR